MKKLNKAGDFFAGLKEIDLKAVLRGIPSGVARFFKNLNGKQQLAFWLSGLVLFSFLVWFLTGDLRVKAELNAVNRILEAERSSYRLKEIISPRFPDGNAAQAGNWYLLKNNNPALVWAVPFDGIMVPYLVVFNKDLNIDRIYPLSTTAKYMLEKKNFDVTGLYRNRLLKAARQILKGSE